jgi:hypothetical protein
MRWRRGLLRTWILLSAIWCVAVAGFAYLDYRNAPPLIQASDVPLPPECKDTSKSIPISCLDYNVTLQEAANAAAKQPFPTWIYFIFALVPPFTLLGFGATLGWTVSGFKPT